MSELTDSTVEALIRGALQAWGLLERLTLRQANDRGEGVAMHDASDRVLASVWRADSPLGRVWYVRLGDRRERPLSSIVTTLRYLRGHLCPEREAGRLLFGPGGDTI
ncbi:MAG: hypothetical protein AB7N91_07140 [Candidatus Tectimicrobiota bacterium]